MTAPTLPLSTPAVPPPRKKKRRWRVSRKFLRGATPMAVVLAVFLTSGILWWVEQLDPSDPAYLSPVSAEQVGGKALANLLTARGVTVERYTNSPDAIREATQGDATLFIPAPGYVWPGYYSDLAVLPRKTRVVLIAPSNYTLSLAGLPVELIGDRWAPGTVPPDCDLPEAAAAGAATALVNRYAAAGLPARHSCYDGGLLSFGSDDGNRTGGRLDVIGAAEPFTNDRLGDAGNAALTVGLLSAHPKLIWLDLHDTERPPPVPDVPGEEDGDYPGDDGDSSGGGDSSRGGDSSGGEDGEATDGSQADEQQDAWPLLRILPPWMVALLAQLLLAAVLCALWQGRRLGVPVAEPLPVVVRSAETVEGRARLYQRARARGTALAALRAGALRRLVPALDLPTDAPADTIVASLAARTGWPADRVRDTLYGTEPDDDATLEHAVAALDHLVRATTGAATRAAPHPGAPPRTGKDNPR